MTLLTALAASTMLKVVYVPDNGMGVVIVTSHHRWVRVVEDRFVVHQPKPNLIHYAHAVRCQGDLYREKEGRLVNERTKQFVALPLMEAPKYEGLYAPMLHSQGGINLGKSIMWIYTWNNMDVQLDPAVLVMAFEVAVEKGKLKVLRTAEIPSLRGYGGVGGFRRGNTLILGGVRNLSVFDLSTWKEIEGYAGTTLLSSSGKSYRIENQFLSVSQDGIFWKPLRKLDSTFIYAAHPNGDDDLLEFRASIMLAKTGQEFRYESKVINGQQPQIFVHPTLGIGVV